MTEQSPSEPVPDSNDPEELEEQLEATTEPAEELSLHEDEPLSEAFLDEGLPLEGFDEDSVESELERQSEPSEWQRRRLSVGGTARSLLPPQGAPPGQIEQGVPTDVEQVRQRLLAERTRLEQLQAEFEREGLRTRSEREDLSELSGLDQHPADIGTETFDRERDISIREQVEGELVEVERALHRLDQGTYGICEACGQPIGADRLEAVPAARLCLVDQLALEREMLEAAGESES